MDTTTITAEVAADLIAEFSPTTAAAFRNHPFHRVAIATAFEAGFRTHSDYSRLVCALVLRIALLDRLDCSLAMEETA